MQIAGQPNFYASPKASGDKPTPSASASKKSSAAQPFPTPAQLASSQPTPAQATPTPAETEADPLEMLHQIRRFVEEDVVFHQEVVGESLLWQLDMLAGLIAKGKPPA